MLRALEIDIRVDNEEQVRRVALRCDPAKRHDVFVLVCAVCACASVSVYL